MARRPLRSSPHGSYAGAYPRWPVARGGSFGQLGARRHRRRAALLRRAARRLRHRDAARRISCRATCLRSSSSIAGNVKAACGRCGDRGCGCERTPASSSCPGSCHSRASPSSTAAADAAVMPRGNGGTSGSLVLALSLATPRDRGRHADLSRDHGRRRSGLVVRRRVIARRCRAALTEAANSPEQRAEKAAAAAEAAAALDWSETARQIVRALEAGRR